MEKQKTVYVGTDIQPHSLDTERAVLATLMRYNDKYSEHAQMLSEELFYYNAEKNIFLCISGVILEGGYTNINSLCDYADRMKLVFLDTDKNFTSQTDANRYALGNIFGLASPSTIRQDIIRLRVLSRRRQCWQILQKAAQSALDPSADIDVEMSGCIAALGDIQSDSDDGVSTFNDALEELKTTVNENVTGKKNSLSTGFRIIDDHFLLRPTTMTVIAAFPAVGKTSFAMNIAKNVARNGDPVAYYSLEMGKQELASRVISKDALMPSGIILNKKLADWQMRDFEVGMKANEDLPIYIDERNTITFDKTIASIRTLVKTKHIKLAIIDYLQIYSQSLDNTEASLGYMAREAKNVAKDTNIAVVVLSQLNRSAPHPSAMMLRGSGQILESTDNLLLIDRPEANVDSKIDKYDGEFSDKSIHGTAKLILAKVRGGSPDVSLLGFQAEYTQFYELEETKPTEETDTTHNDEKMPF